MTFESNYVIVIGIKDSRQCFNQWEAKPKPIATCRRDFSRASSELQVIAKTWTVIGSSSCLLLLWLVGVIGLVLVFRQSFENRSMYVTCTYCTHENNTKEAFHTNNLWRKHTKTNEFIIGVWVQTKFCSFMQN